MDRLVIVPDQKFEPLALELKTRLITIAREELNWERLTNLFGAEGALLLKSSQRTKNPPEIQIWGRSPSGFVVVWTSKGINDEAVGTVTADSERGLIQQVFECEKPDVKAAEHLNASDWTNLEQKRGEKLFSMTAHPVSIFGHCVAVLTIARFIDERPRQKQRDHTDLDDAGAAAYLLTRLVEDRLIRACLGLDRT